ncbi:MAG: YlmC/YmxH family sporulation protein, partial [Clostridia bacterium]|nr:YlmC/YmxH family sporulation protein [Clostridia bacterium]
MKLSELVGKEIINLMDGTRLGTVGDADLVIDPQDGAIQYIVLPGRGLGRFFSGHGQFIIPWSAV